MIACAHSTKASIVFPRTLCIERNCWRLTGHGSTYYLVSTGRVRGISLV